MKYSEGKNSATPGSKMHQRSSLFRDEAISYQIEGRNWGEVAAFHSVSTSMIVWILSALLTTLFIFALFADYARKETVTGYLAPVSGIARIRAHQSGTIGSIHVQHGQRVKQGDALISLNTAQFGEEGFEVADAVLAALIRNKKQIESQIEREDQRIETETRRIREAYTGISRELEEIERQIATQDERIRNAEFPLLATNKLRDTGVISELEFRRRESVLLEQKQNRASLQQQKIVRQNQMADHRFSLEQLPSVASDRMRSMISELTSTEQKIAEARGRRAYVIRSPVDGIISTMQAVVGQNVDAQQSILSIVPNDMVLRAELFAPARSIGFVHTGQEVRILYEAFPFQNFGAYVGRVSQISHTMITVGEATGPIELKEPAYRLTVELERQNVDAYGQKVPLQADMLLKADLILDRRSVLEWLLSPIKGAGMRGLK